MWITLRQIYLEENSVSHVLSLYEELFALKQGDHSIHDYCAELSGKLNELQVYKPISTDPKVIKAQREDFYVAIFLSGLNQSLSHVRAHILSDPI